MSRETVLEVSGIVKSFAGVTVLKNIDFTLRTAEVHAIVGENGAGKSTLIKILSGAYQRDTGEIVVNGEAVGELSPRRAQDAGIVTIYQERNLVPHLSVGENILLGNEPRNQWGFIHWKRLHAQARDILQNLHLDLDPQAIVSTLSSAEQQAVEIAKALYKKVQIVIMDEPTASLTRSEIENLFNIIGQLKKRGVSIIYISHRLDEIFFIADRVTVLRDGLKVFEMQVSEIDKDMLVQAMVGEELSITHIEDRGRGELLYSVRNMSRAGEFEGISMDLHRGEIVGMAGMVGSGRTEVVQAMAGISRIESGALLFKGEEIRHLPLAAIIRKGICFIPENRDAVGLIASMSIAGNTTLASLPRISRGPFLNLALENELSHTFVKTLSIQAQSVRQEVRFLSGGNRQKVMVAKWLCRGIEVFIMDEPTQGVDVGAREEIHRIMKQLIDEGKAILMVSSDLDELMNMSHRIYIMREGRNVANFVTFETTREEVLSFAIGKKSNRG
jgi:ribose transport system ATP-binding protein